MAYDTNAASSRNEALSTSVKGELTKRRKTWSDCDEAILAQLREVEGLSIFAIAQEMHRTEYAVAAKIKRMGLSLPNGMSSGQRRSLTRRQYDVVRRAWYRGGEVCDVARQIDRSPHLVRRAYDQLAAEDGRTKGNLSIATARMERVGPREMLAIASFVCNIPTAAITGATRWKRCVCARVAIAKCLRDRGNSFAQIARWLGRSDHSTAINWIDNFDHFVRHYPDVQRTHDAIKAAESRAMPRLAA